MCDAAAATLVKPVGELDSVMAGFHCNKFNLLPDAVECGRKWVLPIERVGGGGDELEKRANEPRRNYPSNRISNVAVKHTSAVSARNSYRACWIISSFRG